MRLIDADALLEYKFPNGFSRWDEQEVVYAVHEKDILSAPTVEAEPVKHGHWIVEGEIVAGHYHQISCCSYCGWTSDDYYMNEANFCLNCGTKMDEEVIDSAE